MLPADDAPRDRPGKREREREGAGRGEGGEGTESRRVRVLKTARSAFFQRKGDRAHSDIIVTPSLHDLPVSSARSREAFRSKLARARAHAADCKSSSRICFHSCFHDMEPIFSLFSLHSCSVDLSVRRLIAGPIGTAFRR